MLSKAQVKYIQSLSHKKFREEEKLFVAEGPKMVGELIQEHPALVKHLYAVKEWAEMNAGLLIKLKTEVVTIIEERDLAKISQLHTANQVLLLMQQFPVQPTIDFKKELLLMLDGIQDPGNLGTIIRIADWFGIKHVLCSPDCADVYNNKVVQSTMASIGRVQVHYEELAPLLNKQTENCIYAAVLNGISVQKLDKVQAGILLIGNESKGISQELLALANKKITIPKIGKAESLNAAVATGIILSHLR